MTELTLSDSISVAVTPDELYALVSDVTRMGEWSPVCKACWWDEGGAICFRYADEPTPQCWRFLPRDGGMAAELVEASAGTGFVVELSHADAEPLPCPGPKVGS